MTLAFIVVRSEVDSIEVRRLLIGKTVTVTVRGVPIKLEAGGGANAKGLAEEFARVKAPPPPRAGRPPPPPPPARRPPRRKKPPRPPRRGGPSPFPGGPGAPDRRVLRARFGLP